MAIFTPKMSKICLFSTVTRHTVLSILLIRRFVFFELLFALLPYNI